MKRWMVFFVVMGWLMPPGEGAAQGGRPGAPDGATDVEVGVYVLDVDEVDSASQSFVANVFVQAQWRDPALAHGGKHAVTRPLDAVWNPRLQVVNQQRLWTTFGKVVEVAPDGMVTYRQRAWGSFSQPLALRAFPFDSQELTLSIATVGYSPDQIRFVLDPQGLGGIAESFSLPDWDVLGWSLDEDPYQPLPDRKLAGVTFRIEVQRKTGFFFAKVILPLVLIVAMSWIVFWIDPADATTGISVAVTSMLTLIAYRFMVGGMLPAISYLTRLDLFILGSTLLVFATLLEATVTSVLSRNERLSLARKTDRWCRVVFPLGFAGLCWMTLVV